MRYPNLAIGLVSATTLGVASNPVLADLGHDHGAAAQAIDHAHHAPHGGIVRTVGKYHFELLIKGNTVKVYLLDDTLATVKSRGKSGRAILQIAGKGKVIVDLVPTGDHFEGKAKLGGAKNIIAIVNLGVDGKTQSARFSDARKN